MVAELPIVANIVVAAISGPGKIPPEDRAFAVRVQFGDFDVVIAIMAKEVVLLEFESAVKDYGEEEDREDRAEKLPLILTETFHARSQSSGFGG